MVYSISYDLNKPGADYQGLYQAIKNLGDWIHCMDSCWLVDTNLDANGIWKRLSQHIDRNDSCLVTGITNDYSGWLPQSTWTWLNGRKSRMPRQSAVRTW